MRFFDFFAGIGGFRLGMEMAGHTCVGHCEIDKYADLSYRAMHGPKDSEVFFDDIRTVEPSDMPECEVYCFGFPCQAFSIAGHRRGFEDTRGTLFFEVMRLAEVRKPKILFAENVAGLLNHDEGRTFGTIIASMDELGYDAEWQVLNSKNYGVPQNRERVFIIGHLRGRGGQEIFPITSDGEETAQLKLIELTNNKPQGERIYDSKGISTTLSSEGGGMGAKTGLYQVNTLITKDAQGKEPYQQDRVYSTEGIAPALARGKSDLNISLIAGLKEDAEPKETEIASTICARDYKGPKLHGSTVVAVCEDDEENESQE